MIVAPPPPVIDLPAPLIAVTLTWLWMFYHFHDHFNDNRNLMYFSVTELHNKPLAMSGIFKRKKLVLKGR